MKKAFFYKIVLLAVLFTSCSFSNNNTKNNSESGLVTVNGSIKEKAFLAEQERTAVPGSTDNTATYNYTVVAQSQSSGEKYNCTVSGANFSVALKPGYYIFSASGVENSYTSETPTAKKLSGSISVMVNADGTTNPATISINVKPVANTFGTGTASLPICVDNGGSLSSNPIRSARAYWTVNGTSYSQTFNFMDSDTISNPKYFNFPVTGSTTPMQMPSGSHTVQFYFSTSNTSFMNNVCYYFSEVVNIYDGFITNTWVDSGNADYLFTSGTTTSVLITQDCVDSFKRTNFFVKSDGEDIVSDKVPGTIMNPFATIAQAVEAIRGVNYGTEVYTINLLSNIELAEPSNPSDTTGIALYPNNNMYIVIQSCGFEDEPYSIDFNGRNGFDPQIQTTFTTYLMLKDLEIKNVKSDSGISTNMANTYFGGYLIIQENKDSSGTTCNVKLSNASEKINFYDSTSHFTAVPLDSRSKIGVTIPSTATSFPYTITNGYAASLTTTNPMTIFTGDVGYIAGWNQGATADTWHTEAEFAQSSGETKAVIAGPMKLEFNKPEIIVATGANAEQKEIENIHWVGLSSAQTGSAVGDLIVPDKIQATLYQDDDGDGIYSLVPAGAIAYEITVFRDNKLIKTESGTSPAAGGAISRTPELLGISEEGVYTINVIYKKINGKGYAASEKYYVTDTIPLCVYAAQQEFKAKNVNGFTASVPTTGTYSVGTLEDMHAMQNMVNGTWKPDGENVVSSPFYNKTGNTVTRAVLNLIDDISLQNEHWISIGKDTTNFFGGYFKGNNYTIRDLWLPLDQSYNGLFGYTSGALIENLNVAGSTKKGAVTLPELTEQYVGGVVAYLKCNYAATSTKNNITNYIDGVISNCSFNGDITLKVCKTGATTVYIGGIVGRTYQSTTVNTDTIDGKLVVTNPHIDNCKNYAEINITTKNSDSFAKASVGGIAGYNFYAAYNCVNYGNMSVSQESSSIQIKPITYFAGIFGSGGLCYSCSNYGTITQTQGKNAYIGGIFGYLSGSAEYCNNYGKIICEPNSSGTHIDVYTGGVVASTIDPSIGTTSSFSILNCNNYGEVFSNAGTCGGILGYQGSSSSGIAIENCTNQGTITAYTNGGGIIGMAERIYTKVNNCINYGEVTCFDKTDSACDSFGGIIGGSTNNSSRPMIISCENNGNISGVHNVGGIIGYAKEPFFINCKNTGHITGTNYVAGILGKMDGTSNPGQAAKFYNCLNSGMIEQTGPDLSYTYSAGIFCDHSVNNTSTSSKVHNCVNTGYVYSMQFAVGIGNISYKSGETNRYSADGVVKNCYYLLGSVNAYDGKGLSGGIPGFYVVGSKSSPSEMEEAFPSDATRVAQFSLIYNSGYSYTIMGGANLVDELNSYIDENPNYTEGEPNTTTYINIPLKQWVFDETTCRLDFKSN